MQNDTSVSCVQNLLTGDLGSRRRSIGLSLLCAVALHYVFIEAVPSDLFTGRLLMLEQSREEAQVIDLELDLANEDELRFVEANPDTAENQPDQTNQYSYRNQQAADESPNAQATTIPRVDGDSESHKIKQGSVSQVSITPAGVYGPSAKPGKGGGVDGGEPAQSAPAAKPIRATIPGLPVPDFLNQGAMPSEGKGSVAQRGAPTNDAPEMVDLKQPIDVYRVQQTQDAARNEAIAASNGGQPEAKPLPRARPRLSPELIHGPLMASTGSASRRGKLSIDATFSAFGEYQQQFYAAIQSGWYQEIDFFQPIDTGARVQIRFTIQADGTINGVETIHSTASEVATLICESAITKRSPFRKWTAEMVEVFGSERTMELVFHYR